MVEKDLALEDKAKVLRKHIVKMIGEAGSGHPGGSLSVIDIVTALYFEVMKVNPDDPKWPDRDRFILSKGHAAPALYAALAEKGFFPVEDLLGLRQVDSHLQGHPDLKKTPGVEVSTGSLGHGLAVANGMALAGKLDKSTYRVYVVLGDGELQEGSVWEAAMASAHYKLDNLVAILDYNGLQIDGPVEEVMDLGDVGLKWQAFGWHVISIDGHDFEQILNAFKEAETIKDRPTMIVAHTVKGKGVSFMEHGVEWHGTAPNEDQVKKALDELA